MKLKLVMASLSMISFASCPLFAAPVDTPAHKKTTHVKPQAHQKLKKHKEHKNDHPNVEEEDFQPDDTDMQAPISPVPECCGINPIEVIMDEMTQNFGRSMPNPCNPGWFQRLQFSGGINVDMGKWGNRNANYQGENYKRFSLNDAYLNLAASINEWTRAFVSLSFGNPTATKFTDSDHFEYSSVYESNKLTLEQAYATISNFEASPIFLQVGKQFIDFSRYEIHPITRTMTQVLSETLRTSAKLGFIVPMGLNGSIYAFEDTLQKINRHSRHFDCANRFEKSVRGSASTNYGISLGIDQPGVFGWDVGVAYMRNMISAKDIAHAVTNFTGVRAFHDRVGAIAAYADVNSGPFYLGARFTTAVKRFDHRDLPKNGKADLIGDDFFEPHFIRHHFIKDEFVSPGARGAKPWAYGVEAAYTFETGFGCSCPKVQSLYLGYQASHQAAGIGLPLNRWVVGYNIDMWKDTNFGIEWDRDRAYAESHGGNHKHHSSLVTIRTTVQFG